MALTTFSDTATIVAADINSNFKDEEANDVATREGWPVNQVYRLNAVALNGSKTLVIKPKVHSHLDEVIVSAKDSTAIGFYLKLKAIQIIPDVGSSDFLRATNNKELILTVTAGATYSADLSSSFEGSPMILVPGVTYLLTIQTVTPTDWIDVLVSTKRSRGNS